MIYFNLGLVDKLNYIFKKWTTANKEKRDIIEVVQNDDKRLKIDDKIYVKPDVKPPIAKSTVFAQLQTSKLDGRHIVHRTSSDLISGKTKGSMDDAVAKDSPIMPSYKKTASPPPMKEESISEKTGKPKKSVRFNVKKLDSTVYFLIGDRPDQIVIYY
jgi:hypothetical protein